MDQELRNSIQILPYGKQGGELEAGPSALQVPYAKTTSVDFTHYTTVLAHPFLFQF